MEAFIAYPEGHHIIRDAIQTAVELSEKASISLTPWEKLNIFGFKLDDLIRDRIAAADMLVGDITYPNHNVFYELGYAAGLGKPILASVSAAVDRAFQGAQRFGLFDTTGLAQYDNGNTLFEQLKQWEAISWASKYSKRRDYSQPLFVLDTLVKTDFRNYIFHAIEHTQLQYRVFDPAEVPRLTAAQALAEVSASAGVIVPLLSDQISDHYMHNLRAAFLIGLCHGLEVEALVIQYENAPAPLDYRDFISNSTSRRETDDHVSRFCTQTLIRNQTAVDRDRPQPAGLLAKIDMGSPTAENETQQLKYYFIETAEFARALRAEGGVVIGRKGSGKTAVYLQVIATEEKDRGRCIVDLSPASHSLSELREQLLTVVSAGVFDHTIAAFWQYIIYTEMLLKIRERVLPKSRNDFNLQERIRRIETEFELDEAVVAGDFTSRLEAVVKKVINSLKKIPSANDVRTQITNILFETPIARLREALVSFRDQFESISLLVDDLDKGWPPRQVETHDIRTIRHLIEGLNRIQNDLRRRGFGFKYLIFLRSDIYERLVEETSDRGKYNVIRVDWSDKEQLHHLLRRRIVTSVEGDEAAIKAWDALNPILRNGESAISRMIDVSLRRPRFLIDLCERVLTVAVNRGHELVSEDDLEEGMKQMSLYLVSDFGYEMRDVAGTPETIFYRFINQTDLLTREELDAVLKPDDLGLGVKDSIDLLMWYGFIGIAGESNRPVYIYDRQYDFRRLEAEMEASGNDVLFCINPAFLRGLSPD